MPDNKSKINNKHCPVLFNILCHEERPENYGRFQVSHSLAQLKQIAVTQSPFQNNVTYFLNFRQLARMAFSSHAQKDIMCKENIMFQLEMLFCLLNPLSPVAKRNRF